EDLVAEATAVFAATQSHRQPVPAMAPAKRSNRRRLPVWAGMAAVLALVAVGSARLTMVGQGPPDLMHAHEDAEKPKKWAPFAPSFPRPKPQPANNTPRQISISAPTPPTAPTTLRSDPPPANGGTFDLLNTLPSVGAYNDCNADQPQQTYQITRDLQA